MTRRDIMQALLLFLVIAGMIVGLGWIQNRLDEQQLSITCTSARSNIQQLEALQDISRTLGLPTTFSIPEVPAECDEH